MPLLLPWLVIPAKADKRAARRSSEWTTRRVSVSESSGDFVVAGFWSFLRKQEVRLLVYARDVVQKLKALDSCFRRNDEQDSRSVEMDATTTTRLESGRAGLTLDAAFLASLLPMPLYAFACTACGHHFDRLQKLSDPDPATCPVCSAAAVKRQLTAPSFRLSGSGWYETDFKKDGDKKRNLSEKSEGTSSSEAAKPEAKSETKPEAAKPAESKPEAKPVKAEPAPAAKPAPGTP